MSHSASNSHRPSASFSHSGQTSKSTATQASLNPPLTPSASHGAKSAAKSTKSTAVPLAKPAHRKIDQYFPPRFSERKSEIAGRLRSPSPQLISNVPTLTVHSMTEAEKVYSSVDRDDKEAGQTKQRLLAEFWAALPMSQNISPEIISFVNSSIQSNQKSFSSVEEIQKVLINQLILENFRLKTKDVNMSEAFDDLRSVSRKKSDVSEEPIDSLFEKKKGNYWQLLEKNVLDSLRKIVKKTLSPAEIVQFLRENLEGKFNLIRTPYGKKLRLYVDYTASGQELRVVRLLLNTIAENYANTHTEASHDGKFMNHLFHCAELAILDSVKADTGTHSVLTCGSGATGAIEMVQKIIGTYVAPRTNENMHDSESLDKLKDSLRQQRKLNLVLITAYEHHSNDTTWRRQLCDVQEVGLDSNGFLDMDKLKEVMTSQSPLYKSVIVSFSAGSNVTGIKTDVAKVLSIVKQFANTMVFFDYAGVGAYVEIDMRQEIDGIYISPHKFIGGPGSVGVAVIKNRIYNMNLAPTHGGGGTVDFVSRNTIVFAKSIAEREKSGTPGILQTIRAGLVFYIKDMIFPYIQTREKEVLTKFFGKFGNDPRIFILGPHDASTRAPIVSFNIKHFAPQGERTLHPVFVIRLLSDLFGIQGRSGCSCAGPYAHRLFHVSKDKSDRILRWIRPDLFGDSSKGFSGIKLGWARINLHYILSDEDLDYIIGALDFVAEYGHLFLADYVFDPASGKWESLEEIEPKLPRFGFELLLEEKSYTKNEETRKQVMRNQMEKALAMAAQKPRDFPLDELKEWEDLASFYAAKGNVQNKERMATSQANCSRRPTDF